MALTKVAGDILDPGISVAGVVTATAFDGPFRGGSGKDITAGIGTFTELDVNGDADISGTLTVHQNATFNGNVSIAKTLTYEDVTNIDSVGVITARDAIVISEDNAIHFRGIATDDNDAILRASAGGGQLLINSRNDTILNIDSNGDSTDAHFAVAHGAATGSSTELFRIQENGRVGINTTVPTAPLNVLAETSTGTCVRLNQEETNKKASIYFQDATSTGNDSWIINENYDLTVYAGYGGKLNLGAYDTTGMTVLSTGKVGIGESDPATLLEVSAGTNKNFNVWSSGAYTTGITIGSANDAFSAYTPLEFRASEWYFHNGTAEKVRINSNGTIGINTTNSGGDGLGIMVDNNSTNVLATGSIALNLKNKNTTDNTWVSMDFNNSVGGIVGRFGAQFKDTSDKDTDLYFATREDGGALTERMRIYSENNASAGQVKITAPNSGDMLNLQNSTGSGQGLIFGVDTTNHTTYWKNNTSAFYDATFILGSVERLRITGEGSVGIGTTDPGADLHLQVARANLLVEGTNDTVGGNVANVDVRAPYYRKAGYSISDAGGNEDFWIGRPYGEGDSNAAVAINMGGVEKVRLTSTGNLTLTGSTANLFTSDSYNILELRADENNDGGNDDIIFKFTHDGTFRSEMRYDESESRLEISTSDNRNDLSMDTDGKVTFAQEIETPQDYPTIRPTLDFNFKAVKKLDPRITYRRSGVASYIDEYGYLKFVGDDVPRFDHDPDTGECRGLLIEDGRTNMLTSNGGTGAPGEIPSTGSNLGNSPTQSIVHNITLPTGKTGSVRRVVYHSAGNSGLRFGWTSGGSANNPYSASVWARAVSGTASLTIDINDHDNNSYTLTEEWVRMKSTGTTSYAYRFMDLMGGASADVYIWGYQMEQNDHVSSYMPNDNARGADFAYIDGQDFTDAYNVPEGTFILNASNDNFALSNQGTWGVEKSSNRSGFFNMLGYRVGGGDNPGDIGAWYMNNGSQSMFKNMAVASTGVTVGVPYKTALAYKVNDMAATTNGITVAGDTSASIAAAGEFDRFILGSYHYDEMSGGHIQRVMYYRKRLPDTQLVTLTS